MTHFTLKYFMENGQMHGNQQGTSSVLVHVANFWSIPNILTKNKLVPNWKQSITGFSRVRNVTLSGWFANWPQSSWTEPFQEPVPCWLTRGIGLIILSTAGWMERTLIDSTITLQSCQDFFSWLIIRIKSDKCYKQMRVQDSLCVMYRYCEDWEMERWIMAEMHPSAARWPESNFC